MAATQFKILTPMNVGTKRLDAGQVVDASVLPTRSRGWLKRGGYIEQIDDDGGDDE